MASAPPADGSSTPFTMHLSATLSAPGVVRDALGEWLARVGAGADERSDILLCASELVTNAVTHAGSRATVQAEVLDDTRRVRLEVTDASSQRPVKRAVGTAAGGFGIRVVDALATAWGWRPTADGKIVWALFDLGV